MPPGCAHAGHPKRDAVEPVAQQVAAAESRRFANQDQESGLKGVVHVVGVAKQLPAHAQNHRPMPRDQCLECRLVARLAQTGRAARLRTTRSSAFQKQPPDLLHQNATRAPRSRNMRRPSPFFARNLDADHTDRRLVYLHTLRMASRRYADFAKKIRDVQQTAPRRTSETCRIRPAQASRNASASTVVHLICNSLRARSLRSDQGGSSSSGSSSGSSSKRLRPTVRIHLHKLHDPIHPCRRLVDLE